VAAGSLGLTGGRAPSGPVQAQIGISDPCNHECVFCWDHPPKDPEDEDTAKRFGLARPSVTGSTILN
jgi:wyosine [tRNA(Phe)-imidazoG37] synthetase (radical SAM superfamily)